MVIDRRFLNSFAFNEEGYGGPILASEFYNFR
jgi:hypothetical protein